FAMSYDYVGDLSETVALMWPVTDQRSDGGDQTAPSPPRLAGEGQEGGQLHGVGSRHAASPQPSPTSQGGEVGPVPWQEAEAVSAPGSLGTQPHQGPTLSEVVTTLASLGKTELPAQLAQWLDSLDEVGRWALLKLVTGALRIGVSARLAKTAVAALGNH